MTISNPSGKVCVPLEDMTPQALVALRLSYELSQDEFSQKFGLPLAALQRLEAAPTTP